MQRCWVRCFLSLLVSHLFRDPTHDRVKDYSEVSRYLSLQMPANFAASMCGVRVNSFRNMKGRSMPSIRAHHRSAVHDLACACRLPVAQACHFGLSLWGLENRGCTILSTDSDASELQHLVVNLPVGICCSEKTLRSSSKSLATTRAAAMLSA